MTEHIQRNRQGEAVVADNNRDMLLQMVCHEVSKTMSEFHPQCFGPEMMSAAGVMDYDEARGVFDSLSSCGFVFEATDNCFEITQTGRAFLDAVLAEYDLPDIAWYESHEREGFARFQAVMAVHKAGLPQ